MLSQRAKTYLTNKLKEVVIVVPVEQDLMAETKEILSNIIETQPFMGGQALIQNVIGQVPKVSLSQVDKMIQQLCQEKYIEILGSDEEVKSQLICLISKK